LRLLITEHIALGWAELLDLEIFILRCLTLWVVARAVF